MKLKRLFNENDVTNELGQEIGQEISDTFRPLLVKYSAESYSLRDVESIAITWLLMDIAFYHLDQRLKGRKANKKL